MKIRTCMKHNVRSNPNTSTIREAATVFAKEHLDLLLIVDQNNKPVGVVGLRDSLLLVSPDILNPIQDLDFVQNFGLMETLSPAAEGLD